MYPYPAPVSVGQNADRGISDFRISGESYINENCHNSRTSRDVDIKQRPVTKLDKSNTTTPKKLDDDVMLANCDVIVFFPIYGHFAATRKRDFVGMVYKTYIYINSNLSS